jgi:hypothetical protein
MQHRTEIINRHLLQLLPALTSSIMACEIYNAGLYVNCAINEYESGWRIVLIEIITIYACRAGIAGNWESRRADPFRE